ncbi:MAG: sugar ABC transporter substrate-binding protein [Spirochaeta sp.]|nr:sugar ABC transporter substrate-binding protein [Spirochaeta sp.]
MKKLVACILFMMLAGGFAFAGGQGEQSRDGYYFSFVVKDMSNPYWWRMRDGAQAAADEYGVNLNWLAAQYNGDIEGQIGVVESQLALSPDALILVPQNATALCPKVIEANNMGIPVVNPDTRLTESDCGEAISFVGLDEKASAVAMAEFIVEYFDGDVRLAILEGFRGSSTAEERLAGFMEVFENEPGVEVLASQTADWDREQGLKVTENILQAHPDVQLIVASNDEMALGAIQAVQSAGRQGDIVVVGNDAIPAALQALKDGELLATIDGNTDEVGYAAVEAAYRYVVEGARDLPAWTVVPAVVMLQDDLTDEYLEMRDITLD